MPLHAEPVMPPFLEDFPWKHLVHTWGQGYSYDPATIQLKLWLTSPVPLEAPREYYAYALNEHLKVWEWLEQRFEIKRIPEIDVEGKAWWNRRCFIRDGEIVEAGQQIYEQIACWGTYHIALR